MLMFMSPCSVLATLNPRFGVYVPHRDGCSWPLVESVLGTGPAGGSPPFPSASNCSAPGLGASPGGFAAVTVVELSGDFAPVLSASLGGPADLPRNWRNELIWSISS